MLVLNLQNLDNYILLRENMSILFVFQDLEY